MLANKRKVSRHHNMPIGYNNQLARQIGESLVCAELGRRGIIATAFSGNVPAFDILAAGQSCKTLPIQMNCCQIRTQFSNYAIIFG